MQLNDNNTNEQNGGSAEDSAEVLEEKVILKEAIDVAAAKIQESREYSSDTEHTLDTNTREVGA